MLCVWRLKPIYKLFTPVSCVLMIITDDVMNTQPPQNMKFIVRRFRLQLQRKVRVHQSFKLCAAWLCDEMRLCFTPNKVRSTVHCCHSNCARLKDWIFGFWQSYEIGSLLLKGFE